MKMPYLGRIDLHWCFKCNVPVLAKSCGACGETTKKVQITPPGDVRPAFPKDIKAINKTVVAQFGLPLIADDRIVLLNSVPGFDRFDEVIMDGVVVGAFRYDVERLCLEFMPSIEGAARIWEKGARSFVSVAEDAAGYIMKGASVLMPGVVEFDKELQAGQEALVVCGDSVIAVGRTRFSGEVALQSKKGMFVKVRKYQKEEGGLDIPSGGQDWGLVIESNRKVLERYEKEALAFIKKTLNSQKLPVLVSFSGGKDSMATLLLVRKVVEPKVLFIDTGMEFPETLEYVEEIAQLLDLELITAVAEDRFWRGIEVFGMSGRDYRWCCKVCKLGPVAKVIHERFPDGILNFIGQRRYESKVRAKSGRIWTNSWLPNQLSASPIQNWTALHVWLYLMLEGAPVNPLYRLGLERIGCWVCPSSSLAELELVKETHPHLWRRLEESLPALGFTDNEVKYGFWRWRNLPKGQKELRDRLKVRRRQRKRLRERPIKDQKRAENLASSMSIAVTEDIIARSAFCLGCGVCLAHCKHKAIEFYQGKVWINSNCRGCRKCHLRCPIVKYLYEDNIINNHDS
ncbi:MAG: phosphoadenosine phosphosulfate reductase family protein [Candidatus Hydrothermarchaeales archaeon]